MAKKKKAYKGRKKKAYEYKTFGQARIRGYTYKQYIRSKKARERWDNLDPEKKLRIIENLQKSRKRKESYAIKREFQTIKKEYHTILFKVYGYEDTKTGTSVKLEGLCEYNGPKTIDELETYKDEIFQQIYNDVGRGVLTYNQVMFGVISINESLNENEYLKVDSVVYGIGTAEGLIIRKGQYRNLNEVLKNG